MSEMQFPPVSAAKREALDALEAAVKQVVNLMSVEERNSMVNMAWFYPVILETRDTQGDLEHLAVFIKIRQEADELRAKAATK